MLNTLYTNGVIAVKEKSLLGERLPRLCEMTAQDAFRALVESGFGSGAEGAFSAAEGELLCKAEEEALDAFIREYAPSERELIYFFAPRDFHNGKALVKAEKTGTDPEKFLAPEGLVTIERLTAAVKGGEFTGLEKGLSEAIKTSLEGEEITGREIGTIFDKAMYTRLADVCRRDTTLKKLFALKADMTNVLTAFRSLDAEHAEKLYVDGGELSLKELNSVFNGNEREVFGKSPYWSFYELCRNAKEKGVPFTEAEKTLESVEANFFYERRYDLERKAPFLYYVFRRRAEIANVRIVLVCLNAGLAEQDIKRRLRAF